MTFDPVSQAILRHISRVFWLLVMTAGLTACNDEEFRGVLVAKFANGSARFVKRVAISTIDGPSLNLSLVSKSKRCELVAPIPAGALSGTTDCRDISGIAFLRCDGEQERAARWQMTSCHSGYGRSLGGEQSVFLFGFSGNSFTAQNQLELAMGAEFEPPVKDCPIAVESGSPSPCYGDGPRSLSQLIEQAVDSKSP